MFAGFLGTQLDVEDCLIVFVLPPLVRNWISVEIQSQVMFAGLLGTPLDVEDCLIVFVESLDPFVIIFMSSKLQMKPHFSSESSENMSYKSIWCPVSLSRGSNSGKCHPMPLESVSRRHKGLIM
jgi:hypothetical protein